MSIHTTQTTPLNLTTTTTVTDPVPFYSNDAFNRSSAELLNYVAQGQDVLIKLGGAHCEAGWGIEESISADAGLQNILQAQGILPFAIDEGANGVFQDSVYTDWLNQYGGGEAPAIMLLRKGADGKIHVTPIDYRDAALDPLRQALGAQTAVTATSVPQVNIQNNQVFNSNTSNTLSNANVVNTSTYTPGSQRQTQGGYNRGRQSVVTEPSRWTRHKQYPDQQVQNSYPYSGYTDGYSDQTQSDGRWTRRKQRRPSRQPARQNFNTPNKWQRSQPVVSDGYSGNTVSNSTLTTPTALQQNPITIIQTPASATVTTGSTQYPIRSNRNSTSFIQQNPVATDNWPVQMANDGIDALRTALQVSQADGKDIIVIVGRRNEDRAIADKAYADLPSDVQIEAQTPVYVDAATLRKILPGYTATGPAIVIFRHDGADSSDIQSFSLVGKPTPRKPDLELILRQYLRQNPKTLAAITPTNTSTNFSYQQYPQTTQQAPGAADLALAQSLAAGNTPVVIQYNQNWQSDQYTTNINTDGTRRSVTLTPAAEKELLAKLSQQYNLDTDGDGFDDLALVIYLPQGGNHEFDETLLREVPKQIVLRPGASGFTEVQTILGDKPLIFILRPSGNNTDGVSTLFFADSDVYKNKNGSCDFLWGAQQRLLHQNPAQKNVGQHPGVTINNTKVIHQGATTNNYYPAANAEHVDTSASIKPSIAVATESIYKDLDPTSIPGTPMDGKEHYLQIGYFLQGKKTAEWLVWAHEYIPSVVQGIVPGTEAYCLYIEPNEVDLVNQHRRTLRLGESVIGPAYKLHTAEENKTRFLK